MQAPGLPTQSEGDVGNANAKLERSDHKRDIQDRAKSQCTATQPPTKQQEEHSKPKERMDYRQARKAAKLATHFLQPQSNRPVPT